jgi:hypothetical protein
MFVGAAATLIGGVVLAASRLVVAGFAAMTVAALSFRGQSSQ